MQYLYPISSGSSIFHFFEGVSSSPTGPFFCLVASKFSIISATYSEYRHLTSFNHVFLRAKVEFVGIWTIKTAQVAPRRAMLLFPTKNWICSPKTYDFSPAVWSGHVTPLSEVRAFDNGAEGWPLSRWKSWRGRPLSHLENPTAFFLPFPS